MEKQVEKCPWCGSEIPHEQFEKIRTGIRAEEQARFLEYKVRAEREANAAAQSRVAVVEVERDTAVAAKEASEAKLDAACAAARKEGETQVKKDHEQELQDVREVLQKDFDSQQRLDKSEHSREREALSATVRDLQRKLENKTANEIGDGAQIDLYEQLKEEFPDDTITQIKKGLPGADIRHEVRHNGTVCGIILYDSKAREAWRNEYVTKLREDQMVAEAHHAVLSTTVFPRGRKELCLESGVIVVNPRSAVYVATMLRESLIRLHVRGLGTQQRESKTAKLYEFITSNACAELLADIARNNDNLLEIEVGEQKSHETIWKKRGQLLKKQERRLREFRTEMANIIERSDFFETDDDVVQSPGKPESISSLPAVEQA